MELKAQMKFSSDLSRVCGCATKPIHTIGWCDALNKVNVKKLIYSSKLDKKLTRTRANENQPH